MPHNRSETDGIARRSFVGNALALAAMGSCGGLARAATTGARVSVLDFGRCRGVDARPAILAALAALKRQGGGTLLFPPVGGYTIGDTIVIDFGNCTIELQDDVRLTKTTKASAFLFSGTQQAPIRNVAIIGTGARRTIDGNGRNMVGYQYNVADTFYSSVLFRWCQGWSAQNIHAYNGLVNCLRAVRCSQGQSIDCDASFARYDNGQSIDFNCFGASDPGRDTSRERTLVSRARAWNCNGLGITSYAAIGVTIQDAHVWQCGNDIAQHPNNGGGISIEADYFSKGAGNRLIDHRGVVVRALIEDCFNQGIHISANGASISDTRVVGTKKPRNRPNPLNIFGSNVLMVGKGTARIQRTDLANAGLHGIAILGPQDGSPLGLDFDGAIHASGSCGIFGRKVASLSVSKASLIENSGDAGVRIEQTGWSMLGYSNGIISLSGRISGSAGAAAVIAGAQRVSIAGLTLSGNRRTGAVGPSISVTSTDTLDVAGIASSELSARVDQAIAIGGDVAHHTLGQVVISRP